MSDFSPLYKAAFGQWAPHEDPDAGVKFCLITIMDDSDYSTWFSELMSDDSNLQQLEGEPGWELEKLPSGDCGAWKIRAFLDPQSGLDLTYPEQEYESDAFLSFLHQAVEAYKSLYPDRPIPISDLGT